MFNPLELNPPKAKRHSVHGRINSHHMCKLISEWLESNTVKKNRQPDYDKFSNGQTGHIYHHKPNSTSRD